MAQQSLVVPKGDAGATKGGGPRDDPSRLGAEDSQPFATERTSTVPPPPGQDARRTAEAAAQVAADRVRVQFLRLARWLSLFVLWPVVASAFDPDGADLPVGWWGVWAIGLAILLVPSVAPGRYAYQPLTGDKRVGLGAVGLLVVGFAVMAALGPNPFSATLYLAAGWVTAFFGEKSQVAVLSVLGGASCAALSAFSGSDVLPAAFAIAGAATTTEWLLTGVTLGGAMLVVGNMNVFILQLLDNTVLNLTWSLERERSEREERERAQEELANARRVEALGRLAAGIAHDMNNALMVVLGNVSVLKDRMGVRGEETALLDDVTSAAEGAREIVRQLLVLGSQDTKTPGVCNVEDVLARLRKPLERLLPENIDVVMHRHADAWVPLGRPEMERILLNLALNARDAMEQGGVLTIDARARTHNVVIRVSDTGSGMSPETQARIFEPFFTTKEVERGTGLGLATAKGLVTGALGRISVRSEPGNGSMFRVALPRVAPPQSVFGMRNKAPVTPCRVLVVEDDPGVRSSLVRMLRADGHHTTQAEDATQATELLTVPHGFDLMLSDAVMPNSDVPELIKTFHRWCPGSPVIICSGWVQEELVRQGIATGDFLFLAKPFTQNTLREILAEALAQTAAPIIPSIRKAL